MSETLNDKSAALQFDLFFISAALKIESPTRVTVIRSLQIVVSFIVQIQAWNEHPGLDQVWKIIQSLGSTTH